MTLLNDKLEIQQQSLTQYENVLRGGKGTAARRAAGQRPREDATGVGRRA